jgi:hypothetical protein
LGNNTPIRFGWLVPPAKRVMMMAHLCSSSPGYLCISPRSAVNRLTFGNKLELKMDVVNTPAAQYNTVMD